MTAACLARAQKLYGEARQIVEEERKRKQQSSRNIIRLVSILKDLYETFLQREDPHERLVLLPRTKGFSDFRECMLELLRPLDLGERTGWYYLSIGRHLLDKIPEWQLNEVPFEKVKQLARVAKSKGEVPPKLVQRAKDPEVPSAKLREEVNLTLFRGSSDYSDGPNWSFTLVGGRKLIDGIKEKINRLLSAVTEEGASIPASDAQVVEFALADCLAGIEEAEKHDLNELRHARERL